MELQRRKELTEQMFHGMARIVDRFVVCDLENDHYEPCLAGSWIIWVKNKVLSAQTAPYFYGLHVQQAALLAGAELECRSNECLEQRVSTVRTALELRVELCAQMEVTAGQLYSLYQTTSGLVPEITRPASCIS